LAEKTSGGKIRTRYIGYCQARSWPISLKCSPSSRKRAPTSVRQNNGFELLILESLGCLELAAVHGRHAGLVAHAPQSKTITSGRTRSRRTAFEHMQLRGLGEGHGPMAGEAPGTMMTNGTVSAEVVSTPRRREMDITYGGKDGQGVRHVTIPPNVTIREMSLAGRNEIKPGVMVEVRAGQASDGSMIARAILVGANGRPPAG
jgi:hypothetical protein